MPLKPPTDPTTSLIPITSPDVTGIQERSPVVWDGAGSRLIPFARTPTVSTGAVEMYLRYAPAQTGWAAVSATRPVHLDSNYRVTDAALGTQNTTQGITSTLTYGQVSPAVDAKGTVHNFSARMQVLRATTTNNEHCNWFAFLRYENGTVGRAWVTDWNLHGSVGVQQSALNGITMFTNNYYNGSPTSGASGAIWVVSQQASGGGGATEHTAATSYPMDVGIGVVGSSGAAGITKGFTTGLKIGGAGSGWNITTSHIGTGILLQDWDTYGIRIATRYAGATGHAISIASNIGDIDMADDGAGGTTSWIRFSGSRARFGYDGADGNVTIDDNGTNKSMKVKLNGNIVGQFAPVGSLSLTKVGGGLQVKEGSNAKQGVSGAMVAGGVTVANTSITANSRLLLTRQAGGTNPGAVYESTRTAGTSFVITSTNAGDTGTVAYEIFEPAP